MERISKYKQQKFGISKHFMWLLAIEGGEINNFEPTDLLLRDLGLRHFNGTEVKILGCNLHDHSEWVRFLV